MYVVAIDNPSSPGTSVAPVEDLAAALGVSVYDARPHLANTGPRVVALRGDEADAQRLAHSLAARGFAAYLVGPEQVVPLASLFCARSFRLGDGRVRGVHRDGSVLDVDLTSASFLVRGTIVSSTFEKTTSTTTKVAVGRALLTGGLAVTKKVTKTTTAETKEREGFLLVRTPAHDMLFREGDTLYDGLGPKPPATRQAGFVHLVEALRVGAPRAAYDERLTTRPGQHAILGALLAPEDSLDIAVAVVVAHLRRARDGAALGP
ncbi:MAG: hypothetical protein A2138_16210 [Deltaproteobacteria bacterium RBG_16_71_12]|nr:MAG: hypothetical protein A2138_16210 [Deltaproteobacteria bacterium RBG_16_71_12]